MVSGSSEQNRGQGACASCPLPLMRETNSRALFFPDDPASSSLPIALRFEFAPHPDAVRISGCVPHTALATIALLFLLPRQNRRSKAQRVRSRHFRDVVGGIFRICNINLFAGNQNFDSSRLMVAANIADSKLCAVRPRHARGVRLSAARSRSTWQGEGFAAPRCIPTLAPAARVETLPVSTPSGSRGVAASWSWAVRP